MSIDNLKAILEAKITGRTKELIEHSLGRVMQYAQKAQTRGFAILTSWRRTDSEGNLLPHEQNSSNFQSLQSEVREKGWGYVQLRGHWRECADTNVPYQECPEDKLTDSTEPVLMVSGIDQKTAMELGKKYNQDSVLYAGPETDGKAFLHFRDGSTLSLGEFDPMTMGQAYSDFRTKQDKKLKPGVLPKTPRYFKFEGHSYPAQSFIEKMVEEALFRELKIMSEAVDVINSSKTKKKKE